MVLTTYFRRHFGFVFYKFIHPKHIYTRYSAHIHFTFINHKPCSTVAVSGRSIQKQVPDLKSPSSNVNTLCRDGLYKETLDQPGISIDPNVYASLLQTCNDIKSLNQVHAHMFVIGLDQNAFVGGKLMSMYAMCGRIQKARLLFDKLDKENTFLWNVMIGGYARNEFSEEALALYHQMQEKGIPPDKFTFPLVLKACAGISALQEGKEIHDHIVRSGFEPDVSVGNALISFYAKCGRIESARQLFYKMSQRDVVSWNAMIVGCVQNGHANEALKLFKEMHLANMTPDSVTMVSMLQACAHLGVLQQGREIHDYVIRRGFDSNVVVENSLVALYTRCGSLAPARLLFDKMSKRDVVSWNAIIAGYAQNGHANEALTLFYQMQSEGITPTYVTMASAVQACAHLGDLDQGKWIHDCIIEGGFDADVLVGTAIIDMYAKCGSLDMARQLFDRMLDRNVVSWNAMIAGYAQNGDSNEALALFNQMQLANTKPNSATMVSVLPACAHLAALQQGKQIHGCIFRSGFESDVVVGTAVVDMYAKCRSLEIARHLFDKMSERNVVSWNAMITGYAQTGHSSEALELFNQMQLACVTPNSVTMLSVLQACSSLGALQQGKCIHNYVIRSSFDSDVFLRTAIIDMYAKCGSIDTARQLFDQMSERNVVSWNAIIAGYAQNGYANEALTLFKQMQLGNMKPNLATMVSVLPACAHLAALQRGKCIHGSVIRSAFESDVFVGNSLIDMYSKCGNVEIARRLFDKMSKRDVVSWNVMIAGYAMHGHGEEALALFLEMQRQTCIKPNHITFLCILTACSHAGLVDEGCQYFDCMSRDYCITPRMEHYASMVDLLGRAGCLDKAHQFIQRMPLEPGGSVWGALLGACRIHCNIALGECAAEHLFDIDPDNGGYYVLLSNIYAGAGRWEDVAKVRSLMKDRGLKKTPGYSLIEVNNRVHVFLAGGTSHPQSEKIYAALDTLAGQMKEAGYMPNRNFVLHDVEDEVKEHMLCSHSEKLAIAFGLINTSPGTPIRITKNLRVCGDCHSATKFISKIVRREILVRDANRFHLFKDGMCSCRDYW
eukprot:Gb_00194 [translate_table: standard]